MPFCLSPRDTDELVTHGPILAESWLALGAEASQQAELFFAWLCETAAYSGRSDARARDPDHPVAVLLLLITRATSRGDDVRLDSLARLHRGHALRVAVDVVRPAERISWGASRVDPVLSACEMRELVKQRADLDLLEVSSV